MEGVRYAYEARSVAKAGAETNPEFTGGGNPDTGARECESWEPWKSLTNPTVRIGALCYAGGP